MKFNSQKKEYAAAAIDYWFNYITAYEIVPEGIYLPPETYWFIYKKNHIGAAYLKGTGYELTVNGERHTFVPTSYYFKDREPAVYGLYYNDEPSMHQYETVEKLCIEHYKPKYNTQGVTMEFYYQAEMKREDYKLDQNIVKNLHFED